MIVLPPSLLRKRWKASICLNSELLDQGSKAVGVDRASPVYDTALLATREWKGPKDNL